MDKEGKGLVLHRGDVEYNVDKEGIRVYLLLSPSLRDVGPDDERPRHLRRRLQL